MNALHDRNSVILIGGPDAGKSNFIFRLWIAIDEGKGALVKDGLPPDVEYLRAGAESLLQGKFAGHTSKEVRQRVHVPVQTLVGRKKGILVLPDVPGEQILAIYRDRRWSDDWEELISGQAACLLFIRAGSKENVVPLDWAMCFEKYGAVPQPPPQEHAGDTAPHRQAAEAVVEHPTQVVLTDWLQFLKRAFTSIVAGRFRPRVGLVVSAWDAVPREQQEAGPVAYLKDNFPMLHQFVEANDNLFAFQIFAVSVVDGDLENDEEFKQRYSNGRPQDFGMVLHSLSGHLSRSDDLTVPVAWALGMLPTSE